MGRLLALIAFVTFAGCECPGDGVCMALTTAPDPLLFTIAGTATTARVVLPVNCGSRSPESVDLSVLDPSNVPVDFDAGAPTNDTDGFATLVTFTPAQAGAYHVVARFQPNFGSGQLDVIAAADHRAAPAVATVPTVNIIGCDRVDVTGQGRVLCQSVAGATVLDAGITFSGPTDYTGHALWLMQTDAISRWVEADGGLFVQTHVSVRPEGQNAASLLAHDRDVVVLNASGALGFSQALDDGGVSSVDLATTPGGTFTWRDAAVATQLASGALCVSALDGGPVVCPTVGPGAVQTPFAEDTTGIWERSVNAASQVVITLQSSSGSIALPMPSGWDAPTTAAGSWEHGGTVTNAADAGALVLGTSDGEVLLEAYARTGETLGQVNSRFVVLNGPSGTSRIVAR